MGLGSVSGPGRVPAHHPEAAVAAGNLVASAPPGRVVEGQVWRHSWGRVEAGPGTGRPGGPAGCRRRGGGGQGQ